MSGKLSSELKNWFCTLGFDDRGLSSDEMEEEFNRLSPPEMRDIWRSIMNHVLPIDKSRYIKKVLLLHELKKASKNNQQKQLIKKNINSIKKWQTSKSQEKVAEQVNNCLRNVEETYLKINDKNQQICDMDDKWKNLMVENNGRNNQQTMIELKMKSQEEKIDKLFEIHSYLMNINSSESSKNSENQTCSTESLKNLLQKINDFSKRRNYENNMKVVDEQQLIMDDVIRLTSVTPVSELHKTVICMLRDTLNALVKLSDHVSSKQDHERSRYFSSKLTQLKKQSVELFLENDNLKKKVEKLRENYQNRRLQLLTTLNEKCDEQSQKNFEMWLDSESLKLFMTTRLNYLIQKDESMKRTLPMSIAPDFSNSSEQEKLFRVIVDCKRQLELMELEMSNNLMYLTDESINSFVACQKQCKCKIEEFMKMNTESKYEDTIVALTDSLKKEITLLKEISVFPVTNELSFIKTNVSQEAIPDYMISEFVKKSSFYVYLTKAYNDIRLKIDNETLNAEFLEKKRIVIQNVEEKFVDEMRKLIYEAKCNQKNIEEYSDACQKNYDLWSKSSVNEIIPPQILVADRNFNEWFKRYVAVIQYLRRQQIELSKLD